MLYLGGLSLSGRTLSETTLSLRERIHSIWEDSLYLGGLCLPGRSLSLPGRTLSLSGRTHSTWEDSLSLPGRTLSTVALGGILPPATPCWGCVLESSFSLPRSSIQDRAGAIDEESAGMGLGPFTHQVKDCGPGGAEGRLHGGSHGEGLERGDWRGSAGTEAQKN